MGTQVVAGVTPGRAGETIYGLPVFDDIATALLTRPADACVLFVPPLAVEETVYAALAQGVKLMVVIAEHVPLHAAPVFAKRRCRPRPM